MSTPKQRRTTFQKKDELSGGRERSGSRGASSLKRLTTYLKKEKPKEQPSAGDSKSTEMPQLFVQVIGAKDLVRDEQDGYLYVNVTLEQVSTQTNYVRAESLPRWDESFVFVVNNKMTCLELTMYYVDEEGRENVYLGEVNVPVHTLGSHRGVTDWFALTDPSSGKRLGELELQLFNSLSRSSSDAMRDLNEVYKGLIDIVKGAPLPFFTHFFESIDSTDSDKVAASVVTLFAYNGKELELFKHVISVEVEQTMTTSVLFRSNSMAIRLISVYTKLICKEYLQAVLKPLMQEAMTDSERYEIDPSRAAPGTNLQRNHANLLELANKFLARILQSSQRIPSQFVHVCKMLVEIVEPKFAGFSPRALGGVFFLRLVCPAIVAPTAYSLLSEHPAGAKHRALVLVAKLLQSVANRTTFKEDIMAPMNPFLQTSEAPVDAFLASLSTLPVTECKTISLLQASVVVEQCSTMTKVLRSYSPKMRQAFEEDEAPSADVVGALDAVDGVLLALASRDEVYEKPYDSSRLGPELTERGVTKLRSTGDLERDFITEGEDDANTLNTGRVWTRPARPGVERELLERLRGLYLEACKGRSKHLDWAALGRNTEYKKIAAATCELQNVDLQMMASQGKKLAFWLNVYNLLHLHLCFHVGPPSSGYHKRMFHSYSYRIGRHTFSLLDIENGVLRGNPLLSKGHHQWKADDERRAHTLPLDARVHFCLCHLQTQSGPLMVFSAKNVERDMVLASHAYLNRYMEISAPKRELLLPKIFMRLREDFVGSFPGTNEDDLNRDLLRWAFPYLRTKKKFELSHLLQKGCTIMYSRSSGKSRLPSLELEMAQELRALRLNGPEEMEDELPSLVADAIKSPRVPTSSPPMLPRSRSSSKKSPRRPVSRSPRTSGRGLRRDSSSSLSGSLTGLGSHPGSLSSSPVIARLPLSDSSPPKHASKPLPIPEPKKSPKRQKEQHKKPPPRVMQRGDSVMDMDILRASLSNMTGRVVSAIYDTEALVKSVLAEVSKSISLTTAFSTGQLIRNVKLRLLEFEGVQWTTQKLQEFKEVNQLEPPKLTDLQKRAVSKNKQEQMLKLLLAIQTAVVDISFLLENVATSLHSDYEWDLMPVSKRINSMGNELSQLLEKLRKKNSESAHLESALGLNKAVEPEISKIRTTLSRIETSLADLDLRDEDHQLRLLKFAAVLTYVKKQLASPKLLPPFDAASWKPGNVQGGDSRFADILGVMTQLITGVISKLDLLTETVNNSLDEKQLTEITILVENIRASLYTDF